MKTRRKAGRLARALALSATCIGAVTTSLATAPASASPIRSTTGPAPSGTAYWAEQPASSPNWIFPFSSVQYYSIANVNEFQQLMYRPLYWLSHNGLPALDANQSLANAPVFSSDNQSVTISLKGWKWSDGTTIDAQDVIFFLNMMRAEVTNWGGWVPGELPDNIASVTAPSAIALSVTIKFKQPYNRNFVLFSELSQITPMPIAWDISKLVNGKPAAPGSGGCSAITWNTTTASDCQAVWKFMTDNNGVSVHPVESGDLATYATNPLWQVVDGPWHLSGFTAATGQVTMVPNSAYSGGNKPRFASFVELPFTTNAAEYSYLASHNGVVGYLPLSNAPQSTVPGGPGPNSPVLAANYSVAVQYPWQVNSFPINFNSVGDGGQAGLIFRQLYFRQVLQELVNQPGIISTVDHNYGVADDGPVPTRPASQFLSSGESTNPYPYNQSKAITTLEQHGWKITAGQTATCSNGRMCGSGIKTGTKLSFTMVYATGLDTLTRSVEAEVSSWSKAGITVTLKGESFNNVIATATPCQATQSTCTWEMADWGGGWIFEPDCYPSGEYQYATGAGSNSGSYSSAQNDSLIKQSIDSNTASALSSWENFAAQQEPVVWQPVVPTIVEIPNSVGGVGPLSALETLTPETWYPVS